MVSVYAYRADSLRHSKTVNGHTTTHVWDRGSIILELNDSGEVVNRFSRGLGHLIHSYHHGFYLFNVRTDVVQRVDSDGNILHTYRYDAFGNQLNGDAVNTNPFRFAAEYYDFETGFIYLRARFYNPLLGRFISEDPYWTIHNMQFGSIAITVNGILLPSAHAIIQAGNLFVFCRNNPVMFIDPSGLNCHINAQQRAENRANSPNPEPIPWTMEDTHIALDLLGLTPKWGFLADGLNATLYLAQGDWENAAISGLAMVPVAGLAAGSARLASRGIDAGTSAVRAGSNAASAGTGAARAGANLTPNFRTFNHNYFRHNLTQLIGPAPSSMVRPEAHHVLPQANRFSSFFSNAGLNIHDPRFGSWVDMSTHRQFSSRYNAAWDTFMRNNPNANADQILREARRLSVEFGFTINF